MYKWGTENYCRKSWGIYCNCKSVFYDVKFEDITSQFNMKNRAPLCLAAEIRKWNTFVEITPSTPKFKKYILPTF